MEPRGCERDAPQLIVLRRDLIKYIARGREYPHAQTCAMVWRVRCEPRPRPGGREESDAATARVPPMPQTRSLRAAACVVCGSCDSPRVGRWPWLMLRSLSSSRRAPGTFLLSHLPQLAPGTGGRAVCKTAFFFLTESVSPVCRLHRRCLISPLRTACSPL